MSGLRETHRNMENIRHTDCASRVFNLLDLTAGLPVTGSAAPPSDGESGGIEPFFAHPALNDVIFLKHRLRSDEGSLFAGHRTTAMKIFLPFNHNDLGDGGRFAFIGERRWQKICLDLFGLDPPTTDPETCRDLTILEILDELPSLDPFLLRERLRMEGITPALDYFRLPDADYAAIGDGVAREFLGLARPEVRQVHRSRRGLGRAVRMMWDCRDPAVVGALTRSLGVAPEEIGEVMFAWKGFIYYKSLLPAVSRNWPQVREHIASVRVFGASGRPGGEDLGSLRGRVLAQMQKELTAALDTIRRYDQAYRDGLLNRRDPGVFRTFLARAPELFPQLGSGLATVRHTINFWRYRFGNTSTTDCASSELHDILTDFSVGPGSQLGGPPPPRAPAMMLLT